MDHKDSKESGSDVDLESGGEAETSSEEQNEGQSSDSGDKNQKKMLSRLSGGHFGNLRSTEGSDRLLGASKNILSSGDKNLDILVNGNGEKAEDTFMEKEKVNEKRKKTSFNNKKHPKPPRPPGAPSLDEADMKFVKEISERARLRHKSRESVKALKKMKAIKAPSFNINLIAMIITIIFCLVIIFQGNVLVVTSFST